MNNTLVIARREFLERVRSRGFIMSLVAVPLLLVFLALSGAMSSGGAADQAEPAPAPAAAVAARDEGVVDHAGLLAVPLPPGLRHIDTEAEAAQLLRDGEIEVYYVIPEDHRETGNVQRVSLGLPLSNPETGLVESLLSQGLAADLDPAIAERLASPVIPSRVHAVLLDEETTRERQDPGMMPFLAASAIMVPLFTGGGLLLRGLAEEKESRIMEVLLSSVRPVQLLTGKLLGMGALIGLQYLAWVLVFGITNRIGGQTGGSLLSALRLDTPQLVVAVLYALGGFALYAALMAGLGALTPDTHSSQAWIFIITLPMMVPFYLWLAIVQDPQGLLATVLSLVPFSAPLAMIMRITSGPVPTWQIVLGLLFLAVTALETLRLMARLFRAQTLLSGEPLSWRRLVETLGR